MMMVFCRKGSHLLGRRGGEEEEGARSIPKIAGFPGFIRMGFSSRPQEDLKLQTLRDLSQNFFLV